MKIYALKDPRNGSIKYIGCTKQSLIKRLGQHLCDKNNIPKTAWTRELVTLGFRPLIEPIHRADGEDDEKYWINHFRESGHDLLNVQTGGPGYPGTRSDQHQKRLTASLMGHAVSLETREKISQTKQATRPTHCPSGHEYNEKNLYIKPSTNTMQCRSCKRDYRAKYHQRTGK